MPGIYAGAELGLMDMDIQMDKAKIMVYAGVMSNEEDTLSHEIMKWKLHLGKTEEDAVNDILKRLGLDYKAEDIALLGRQGLKRDLKEAAEARQQERWVAFLKTGGDTHRAMKRRKPKWGLDNNLARQYAHKARRYIQLRMDRYVPTQPTTGSLKCARCSNELTSVQHELWLCPDTQPDRLAWLEKLRAAFPATWEKLSNTSLDESTDFILGAGEETCGKDTWEALQKHAVNFIWKMTEGRGAH